MENVTPLRALDSRATRPAGTCSACVAAGVTVRYPSEPPSLLPGVAGVLLRILRAVAESDTHRAPGRERAA
jgi:hypothetical protein